MTIRTLICMGGMLLAAACVHEEVITINATPALAAIEDVPEELLLDIGIRVFDPNVPDDIEEQNVQRLIAGVRNAEARYMPHVLRDTLQETGHWGAVRVLPRGSENVDVVVSGRILVSDGETLTLEILASDATGRVWIDNEEYTDLAGRLNYRKDISQTALDPFQDLYNEVANDLLAFRQKLTDKQVVRVREVTELRFATDIASAAFANYLDEQDGRFEVRRLPARDDPMINRVRKIRDRELLFVDTLDQHYGVYANQIGPAYDDWRRYNYDEVVELRRLQRDIRRRTLTGAALIVGGLAVDANSDSDYASYAGQVGALVGVSAILSTLPDRPEAQVHVQTMRELGDSFALEVRPAVLEVEGKTITLTGSVDQQFEKWRELLRDIYTSETGLPAVSTAPSQADPDG